MAIEIRFSRGIIEVEAPSYGLLFFVHSVVCLCGELYDSRF